MVQGLRKSILVVEDEPHVAKMIARRLELSGYEVHIEGTGQGALVYLAEHQPDLVTLDLRLPDLSGLEVCKHLRQHYGSWAMPVLMLTALDQPIDQLRGFAHGADAYLTKPFESDELVETVALLLGETAQA